MQLAAAVQQVRATQESFPLAISNERNGEEDLAVWVTNESPWFGVLEELESDVFFDGEPVPYASSGFDFEFLVIVGGDHDQHRVRHVMRVGLPTKVNGYPTPLSFLAHDLIQSGQGIEYASLAAEYAARGYDLARIPSVETSIRTEALKSRLRSTTVLGYYSLVERLRNDSFDGVFAYNNKAALKSMRRIGIVVEDLSEGAELRTPKLHADGFDESFEPNFMPVCEATVSGLDRLVRTPPRLFADFA